MRVTAVCPITSDRAMFLPSLIVSFLKQSYTDSELLIVADGHGALDVEAPSDPRVRLVRLHGPQRRIGEKRNAANAVSLGEVILHFDSDDWSHPQRIADQLEFMDKTGKAVVGYSDLLYYRLEDRSLWRYQYQTPSPYATGTSLCYLKSWWEKHKFDTRVSVGEDALFSSEAYAAGQLASVASKMIVARAHNRNTFNPTFGQAPFYPAKKEDFPEEFFEVEP